MSDKERIIQMLDYVPDRKIGFLLAYLQGLMANEEATDDEFCEALYDDYLASPDRGQTVSFAEAASILGVSL